jgi:hypothetical protein
MTAPLNPAPTMQYLIPSVSDYFEEIDANSSRLAKVCPVSRLPRRLFESQTTSKPLKKLMPSSNPHPAQDRVSTQFPKWL